MGSPAENGSINSTNLSFHMETENTMIIWFSKPEGATCTTAAVDNTFIINCTIERPVKEDLERLKSADLFEIGQRFKGIARHTSRYEFPCQIGSLVETPSNWKKSKLGPFHVWEIPKKAALQADLSLKEMIKPQPHVGHMQKEPFTEIRRDNVHFSVRVGYHSGGGQ